MSWFKKKEQKSINQFYSETTDISKKRKYWDSHINESFYDPMYDFRKKQKPTKKKSSLFRRKKEKKDKFEEGRERVKKIIKN